MTWTPPTHIAVALRSRAVPVREVAYWVEAVRLQLQLHAAPLWGAPAPGVALYETPEAIPEDVSALVHIVDDDGNPSSAGWHTDLAGRIYGVVDLHQSRDPAVTLSHECLELWGNPRLDRWKDDYAIELCDAVQEDVYEIPVTLFGETRAVPLADFCTPQWWGMPAANGHRPDRTTYLDSPLAPFTVGAGGYAIHRTPTGGIEYLSRGQMIVNRSAHSRTDRIRRAR